MQLSVVSLVLLGVSLGLASPSGLSKVRLERGGCPMFCLEEHNFVKALIQNFDHNQGLTWIGLSDMHKEGAWMWSDGCPKIFDKWSVGQPDNAGGKEHCGEICFGGEKNWNDRPCSTTFPSVCATRKPEC
ncbi:hypothetical protein WMY93_019538 [Mugilogobius chulae]|uniref:C-type lectin domain-containing protein n=1 Tax=Mugilogobius chulae TaxID=88201 RepID=A0AAW0NJF9_9GOBI